MARWIILKNNYAINAIEWDGITEYQYPFEHDSMYEDIEGKVNIGDWYEQSENLFYRPLETPPDYPNV
jgi:hypothetical protein